MEQMMYLAKQMLVEESELLPVLISQTDHTLPLRLPLAPEDTAEERQQCFHTLRDALAANGYALKAAVLLFTDSHKIDTPGKPDQLPVSPDSDSSSHALAAIGRNAEGTQYSFVVQPYFWTQSKRVLFLAPLAAEYAKREGSAVWAARSLDALFTKRTPVTDNL